MSGFIKLHVKREWFEFKKVGDVCVGVIKSIAPQQASQFRGTQTHVILTLSDGSDAKIAINEKPCYQEVLDALAVGKTFRITLREMKGTAKYYDYEELRP